MDKAIETKLDLKEALTNEFLFFLKELGDMPANEIPGPELSCFFSMIGYAVDSYKPSNQSNPDDTNDQPDGKRGYYKHGGMDLIEAVHKGLFPYKEASGFLTITPIKYLMRWPYKYSDPKKQLEDLDKADYYVRELRKLVAEHEEADNENSKSICKETD